MRAADIGTSRVIQLNELCGIHEAASTMRQHDVGCVVVVKNTVAGTVPTGIVTDRDLTIRLLGQITDNTVDTDGQEKTLRDIQSLPLATCRADATVDELISIMLGSHVRRVPIVDDEGQLAGIVCLDDVVAALAELMHRVSQALTGERAIDR